MIKIDKIKNFLLSLYMILYILYPKIYGINTILIFLISLYFLICIKYIKLRKGTYIFILLILLFYFIPSINYKNYTSAIINFLTVIVKISPLLIFIQEINLPKESSIYYEKNGRLIKKILLTLLIYIIIINLYNLNINPYFARNMANYNYDIPGVTGLSLFSGGGYFIVYAFIFLILFIVQKYIFFKEKKNFTFIFLFFIFSLIFLIKANFATAFILTMISIVVIIFFNNLHKINIIYSILLILSLIVILNYSFFLREITKLLPSDSIITIRINDMLEDSETSTVSERAYFLENSIKSIKEKPIIGIASQNNYNYNLMKEKIGLHTEWIDYMAQYGLIIGFVYVVFVSIAFTKMVHFVPNKSMKSFYISSAVSTMILGFLNPVTNTGIYLMLFLVIPILDGGFVNEKNI